MKKKSRCTLGLFNPPAIVGLLVCGVAACSLIADTLLALLPSEKLTGVFQRTLTFEERVSYQRAIEQVYWRYRIWPKERTDPKPPLDAMMSQAQVEKKVEN
jgi:hypothetical protein